MTARRTRFAAALATSVGRFQALATAARGGDRPTVTRLEAALTASPTAALAKRYGLRSCGTAGATTA